MVGSLYSGISGIKTHQVGIDVTSNKLILSFIQL